MAVSGRACGFLRGKPWLVPVSVVGLCVAVLIPGGCTDSESDSPTSTTDGVTSTTDGFTSNTIAVTMEGVIGQTPTGQKPTAQGSASPATSTSESSATPGNTSTSVLFPMMEGQAYLEPPPASWDHHPYYGLPPPGWNRYENNDPLLHYSGTGWWTVSSKYSSGGNYYMADSAGDAVEIKFTGIGIQVIGIMGPGMGKVKLTLDGGTPFYMPLYMPVGGQEVIWSTYHLGSHLHSLKIEWSGEKNSESTGTVISIDAVDVTGTLVN